MTPGQLTCTSTQPQSSCHQLAAWAKTEPVAKPVRCSKPTDSTASTRRGRWLGRTSTSTSLECRPSARRPGSTAGPLRWSRSMPRSSASFCTTAWARWTRAATGAARTSVSSLMAPIVPVASRRVSRFDRARDAPRPTLASMTFGDFVRLSRAYVVGADRLHGPRRRPDGRQDHPGPGALLRHVRRPGEGRQRGECRSRSRATPSSRRTRPTSTPTSSPRRRSRSGSSRSSTSTCRRARSPAASRRASTPTSTRSPSPPSARRPRRPATWPTRSSTPSWSSPSSTRPARRTRRGRRSRGSSRSPRPSCPARPSRRTTARRR